MNAQYLDASICNTISFQSRYKNTNEMPFKITGKAKIKKAVGTKLW